MDIRESITVGRPIGDVRAFFQVPRNNFAWQADLLGQTMVRMSPELVGRVGCEWRKRTGASTWEVTERATERTIGFKGLSGPAPSRRDQDVRFRRVLTRVPAGGRPLAH
jgi:hypothetical protein